jgi:hypothetical protein
MAGLFGLFGNKTKFVDEPDPVTPKAEKKEAFFLEPDQAQSLGDAEFMRTPITTRRTFPKTLSGKGAAIVQEVSSMSKKQTKEGEVPSISLNTSSLPESPTEPVKNERRTGDDSLDMFRKMAKDLKK